jgi:L-lactate dehydrogenase complex protein LldF
MKQRKEFHIRARKAIADPNLQTALDNNAARSRNAWNSAFESLPDPDGLRQRAHEIRKKTIENIDEYLAQFIKNLRNNGVNVHQAIDAKEAAEIVVSIVTQHSAKLAAKSKSMVTGEIGLNHALEEEGVRVVETDLGEFIVQLRGEPPSHIIAPAVHLRREDVAHTFQQKLGMSYTTDIEVMNDTARKNLREVFLSAGVGISGVNFGIAENGTLCVVTNEGNGRMVTTLPPVHIAVMGLERLVPTYNDLAVMLQLLPRSATGQKISSYVNLINSPRQSSEPDGPNERHLVIVDNGRLEMSKGGFSDGLMCIRCGACLDACPVFQELGGFVYNSVYPGPIGSIVSPMLFGLEAYGHLSKASSLCGACKEVCPVQIDLPSLLLRLRKDYTESVSQPPGLRIGMKAYCWGMETPDRYHLFQKSAALLMRLISKEEGWIRNLPLTFTAWTKSRHFPPFASKPFRERWEDIEQKIEVKDQGDKEYHPVEEKGSKLKGETIDLVDQFRSELTSLGGEFIRCDPDELARKVTECLKELDVESVVSWESDQPLLEECRQRLIGGGITLIDGNLPIDDRDTEGLLRQEKILRLASTQAGLTGAAGAFADTGTLVQPAGTGMSLLASLLPPIHLVILFEEDIYSNFGEWLIKKGKQVISDCSNLVLISGPSRTADIESTLTIGVHGPGEVIVFCVPSK